MQNATGPSFAHPRIDCPSRNIVSQCDPVLSCARLAYFVSVVEETASPSALFDYEFLLNRTKGMLGQVVVFQAPSPSLGAERSKAGRNAVVKVHK